MGTPLYMSPEQVRSAKNVDLRTVMNALSPFSSRPIAEMSRPTLPRAASSHDFVNVHAETLVLAPGPQSPVTVSATAGNWVNPPASNAQPNRRGLVAGGS